ncbi:N-6 DNA methylase [Candidatus Bathyarchaeota archaeon]|nr:N-6 DNA methylase [Candidatus Bathyarchaeota archaeon]
MSGKALAEAERTSLNLILEDLRFLFAKDEILQDEVEGILQTLKSEEVKSYIQNLRYGSKPETALRESFIAGKSVLLKYLFGEGIPEVRSDGFIDYLLKDEMGRGIALELKPLFEAVVKLDKAGKPILEKLKQKKITPEIYAEQILKYIREGEAQFVILTNLKEWFFYSKELSPKEVKYFCAIGFFDFIKEYDVVGNLRDYLERKEFESIRYDLDKWFLQSLKTWVGKLSEIEFIVDDKRKLELIIGLINKFIFVQTLDDYGVIEFNWIRKRWNYQEQMWQRKGKLMVLEKFFDEVDNWFYQYYDTELFKEKILQHIKKDDENIDKLYRNLQLILGLTYLQVPFGALKGIMQHNFRYIDEDVLGKAYEIFLGEIRKEEGVYYTPKYITQYIAENTVGKIFDELLAKIKEESRNENFEGLKDLVSRFTSIRILDPACGSGSFLIKAIRIVVSKYRELNRIIEDLIKKYSNYRGSLDLPQEDRAKTELLSEIKEIIGPSSDRELIARILVRHIHGVDLDRRALEVAKVNIWLEAIKLAPKEFRYDKLPAETNYILPSLEMNLCNGDSLVGLPEESTIKYLGENFQEIIIKLSQLRRNYMENPMEPKFVDEVENLKVEIRNKLGEKFREFLKTKDIAVEIFYQTKPFLWALEFWYAFFSESGVPLPKDMQGFDVVLGNPPYVENKRLNGLIKKYLQNCGTYKTAYKLFDYAVPFIERAIQLLKRGGQFGYIVTNKFTVTDYGIKIREILTRSTTIEQILDVSYLPVFEGTAIYPIILIFTKLDPAEDHEIKIAPKVSSEEDIIQTKYEYIKTKQTAILKTPGYIFDISGNILLCDKIRSLNNISPKEIAKIGYRVLKFTGWDELLGNVTDKRPNEPHLKFIGCGNIEPYLINWDSELRLAGHSFKSSYLKKPSQADESKWKLLELPKILVREVGIKLTAALDECGEYGNLTGMYALYDISRDYEPRFILALLNSSLLDFYYKSLYGSTHMAGGYLNFHGTYIENLPILKVEAAQQKAIADYVRRLEHLKKTHHVFFKIWKDWCTRLKTSECSLYKILCEDARFMQTGKFDKAWTIKVTFYPTENATSKLVFYDFKIVGEPSKHGISIYGLDENNKEQLIYEMELSHNDLMLHIYCCLLQALASRVKIKTLFQLLDKTTIPIIKEVNENPKELTPNIVKKAKYEVKTWLREQRIEDIEADIVKVDNEIKDIEASIDARVFRLYQLNEDEVATVFRFLKMPMSHQEKVLEIFRKL